MEASVDATHPPPKKQTFSNQERSSWIDAMKSSRCNSQSNPTFNAYCMAQAWLFPVDILIKCLNVAPKKDTGAKQSSPACQAKLIEITMDVWI